VCKIFPTLFFGDVTLFRELPDFVDFCILFIDLSSFRSVFITRNL